MPFCLELHFDLPQAVRATDADGRLTMMIDRHG